MTRGGGGWHFLPVPEDTPPGKSHDDKYNDRDKENCTFIPWYDPETADSCSRDRSESSSGSNSDTG